MILRIFVAAMALAANIAALTKDRWPRKDGRLRQWLPGALGIIAALTFAASVWLAIEGWRGTLPIFPADVKADEFGGTQ